MARPTVQRGSEGQDVNDLQAALIELDFKPGEVDGVFGVYTESAVKSFQRWAQIDLPDGIVGPVTWEKLENAPRPE
ncbi:MAG TPA: peptidoglycan-binding domain-containing protein [Solirubrobacteraceae bacterium]|nr:peptidoglycan-binding domain-containing protein [Solirubrobacteraceae bacterium]